MNPGRTIALYVIAFASLATSIAVGIYCSHLPEPQSDEDIAAIVDSRLASIQTTNSNRALNLWNEHVESIELALEKAHEAEALYNRIAVEIGLSARKESDLRDRLVDLQLLLSYVDDFRLVRVRNATEVTITELQVDYPNGRVRVGTLQPGEFSKYLPTHLLHDRIPVEFVHPATGPVSVSPGCTFGAIDRGVRGRFTYSLSSKDGRYSFTVQQDIN